MPEEKTNPLANVFKGQAVEVELDGKKYPLVYDLNSFCILEKMYPSVDFIIKMIIGGGAAQQGPVLVSYNNVPVQPSEIMINNVTLDKLIGKLVSKDDERKAMHTDTRNLLWAGLLHATATFDDDGNLKEENLTKGAVGKLITFKNIREINEAIASSIIRDLIPQQDEDEKNVEAPEQA